MPVVTSHPVQTTAQDEAGKRAGTPLPSAEFLQPTLDASLPLFTPDHDVEMGGSLRLAASNTLPGLVREWTRAFGKLYPHVRIPFGPPYGSSQAARELIDGTIDIAFVSRELKPADITAFAARYGYPPVSLGVSGGSYRHFGFLDAVGFFVNRDNPVEHLSFAQLDALLSRSRLRGQPAAMTWGDVGATGTWAEKPIHVYAIKPWNGFEEFVRQRVLDVDRQRGHWRTDLHFDTTAFPIARWVANDPDGIGYSGLAFIDAPVKMLAVGGAGKYLEPTYTNVASARYSLSRLIYAHVNLKPGTPMTPALREFLRFIWSRQGQQIVLDQAVFLPLRESQAAGGRSLINAAGPGPGKVRHGASKT